MVGGVYHHLSKRTLLDASNSLSVFSRYFSILSYSSLLMCAQLTDENSRLKHEWLADQTQLVSSATETENLTEKVGLGFFPRLVVVS